MVSYRIVSITILFTLFFCAKAHAQATPEFPALRISEVEDGIKDLRAELDAVNISVKNLESASETEINKKVIDVLTLTNNALTQRWTPINIILSILAALFAVITILAGIVFSFGWVFYQQHKKRRSRFESEFNSFRDESRRALNEIANEGAKVKDLIKDQTQEGIVKLEKIKESEQKAQEILDKIQKRAFEVVSDTSTLLSASSFGTPRFGSTPSPHSVKICSKCGVHYSEVSSNAEYFFNSPYINSAPLDSGFSSSYNVFPSSEDICSRCR